MIYSAHNKAIKNERKHTTLDTDTFCDIANSIPQIVWVAKPGGDMVYYNKRWYEYTGQPKNNADAKKAVYPDDYEKNQKIWRKSKKSGKTIEAHSRIKGRDGIYRWFLVRMVSMKNRKGEITKWVGTATDVDLHKSIENRSEENERRLRLLMDSVKDYAIFMLDLQGKISSWDIGAEKVLGFKAEEIIGKKFAVLFTDDDKKRHRPEKELAEARKVGRSHNERLCVRKNGSTFWATGILTSIKSKEGKVIGYTKILRDVNDRKLAFDALHESEERFRMLVEEIRDYVIIMLDVKGRITTWNKGVGFILGYEAEDIIGKPFHCFYTTESIENGEPDLELKSVLNKGRLEKEGWRVRRDGSLFWANEIVNAVRNKQGKLQGFVKIIRDMTEAKRNEEILKRYTKDLELTKKILEKENAEDEALLESIGEGVIATNTEGKIVLINKQAQYLLGVDEKDSLGKMFYKLWTTYDAGGEKISPENCPISTVLKTGKKITSNYYFATAKKKFPVASITAPVVLDGATVDTITVFRDIRKEKEVDEAKSEFVSLASHQLRTPLTAIKLFVEMLTTSGMGSLNSEQAEVLENIGQSNEKMIHLVNNFLNVSRIETGKLKVQYENTDLTEFIQNCILETKPLADSKNCTLSFQPKKIRSAILSMDPTLMRQVLNNLLTNAIEYSPEGSEIIVGLERSENKNDYLISVIDHGIGIPKEAQERVFERFYRAENAFKAKTEGSGLGLYMCKIVMETLGGRIWCTSKKGGGTTFFVELPGKEKTASIVNKKMLAITK